jgi:hypothetical protein
MSFRGCMTAFSVRCCSQLLLLLARSVLCYSLVPARVMSSVWVFVLVLPWCFGTRFRPTDAGTWTPGLNAAIQFNKEIEAFEVIAELELQNTTSYINAYQLAELNARYGTFSRWHRMFR